jgi:fibronectin type 3 domain-containing protein/predicted small lipoprotein YifL
VRAARALPTAGRPAAAALSVALPVIVALAAALGGCGKKGPPVAPERRVPAPITDLRAEVHDGAVHLAWTNPSRRADGTRLRALAEARVYRVEDSGAREPRPALLTRGRIAGYTEVLRITAPPAEGTPLDPGKPTEAVDRGGLAYGRRYTYVVLVEDAAGRVSPPSPRVSLTFIAAPAPPEHVTATAGEGQVRLEWAPPARLVDGSPVTGEILYEVLRAPAADAPAQVITPVPVAETALTDRGLENDRTYFYAVRAVRREAGTTARGRPSERTAATPVDVTPPRPPEELVAIPAAGTVRLAWRASPDPDVAAYVVYRARPGGDFERVGSARPPATVFTDRDVPPGTWRYAVTAVDAARRPNESARSNVVTVTVP